MTAWVFPLVVAVSCSLVYTMHGLIAQSVHCDMWQYMSDHVLHAWSLLYFHMYLFAIYNCCCFVIPASKWQFESLLWLLEFHVPLFTLYMGSWWLQQSLHNLCTVTCNNTCLPQTHNTRLCWALPYKCRSKVCHVHVVLSTLYQEKMLTEQEVEELKHLVRPRDRLVQIQCTKPPDVAKRMAELLAEVGWDKKEKQLKGQWVCSVHCCSSVVMFYLQCTIGINESLFSS